MNEKVSLKIYNEEIVFADLTNRNNLELVIVCKSGNIYLFDFSTNQHKLIGTLEFPLKYSEDLFQSFEISGIKKDFSQTYSFGNYVCIVQKYGQNGIVLNLENNDFVMNLQRGEYQVEHCTYPIAFYSKENQTFLIHGTDWNRLDITCLETDELMTNRKSSNKFDYFHSSLLVSPDSKHFTSNGWVWGPYDGITVYEIEKFLEEFEMSYLQFDFEDVDGYNWDRPLCWIDNKTLGIGYNKKEANNGKGDFMSEIIFVNILEKKIVNRINFDGFALSQYGTTEGDLFFDTENKHFIGLNDKSGLLISDIDGKEILRESNLTSHKYSPQHKLFYQIDNKKQIIELKKKLK